MAQKEVQPHQDYLRSRPPGLTVNFRVEELARSQTMSAPLA